MWHWWAPQACSEQRCLCGGVWNSHMWLYGYRSFHHFILWLHRFYSSDRGEVLVILHNFVILLLSITLISIRQICSRNNQYTTYYCFPKQTASRVTWVAMGMLLMVFGVISKFGAVLSTIPTPILGALALPSLCKSDLHLCRKMYVCMNICFFICNYLC